MMMNLPLVSSQALSPVAILATAISILLSSLFLRLVRVIRSIRTSRRESVKGSPSATNFAARNPTNEKVKTMVILGSGGHTTEMIKLLQELDAGRYAPLVYVVADSDATSIPRLKSIIEEEEKQQRNGSNSTNGRGSRWEGRMPVENCGIATATESEQCNGNGKNVERQSTAAAAVHRLPRAREVHQSYFSSAFTTLHALVRTFVLLRKIRPELILANGPGTCVPVMYSAFVLFRLLPSLSSSSGGRGRRGYRDCKIVFVESVCRVRTLSLTGRLAYPIADRFVVHWPRLREKYALAEASDVFVRHDYSHEEQRRRH